MSKRYNTHTATEATASFTGCLFTLILWLVPSFLLAFWTRSNINEWVEYAGKSGECPYWLAWIPSFIFFPITLFCNIISEIVQIFI